MGLLTSGGFATSRRRMAENDKTTTYLLHAIGQLNSATICPSSSLGTHTTCSESRRTISKLPLLQYEYGCRRTVRNCLSRKYIKNIIGHHLTSLVTNHLQHRHTNGKPKDATRNGLSRSSSWTVHPHISSPTYTTTPPNRQHPAPPRRITWLRSRFSFQPKTKESATPSALLAGRT